jgi:DNA polymerase-1
MMGRRRHIHPDHARKAFNAVNQGTAADIIKEKMVHLRYLLKDTGIHTIGQVHDELIFSGPKEIIHDPRCARDIVAVMEEKTIPLKVPLRCGIGIADTNWHDASEDAVQFKVELEDIKKGEELRWLK